MTNEPKTTAERDYPPLPEPFSAAHEDAGAYYPDTFSADQMHAYYDLGRDKAKAWMRLADQRAIEVADLKVELGRLRALAASTTAQAAPAVPAAAIKGLAAYAEGSKSPEVVRWSREARAWLTAATAQAAPASPVLYVSPQQLASHVDADPEHARYLPARKTPAGKFTQPLYAQPMVAALAAGAGPKPDVRIESALSQLVDKILPGIDSGDLLADALAASERLSAIAQPPAEAQEREPCPTAGMSMAQRILHVGGRNNAAGYVEFGSIQAVEALVRQVLRDLPGTQQAAPTSEQAGDEEALRERDEAEEFIDALLDEVLGSDRPEWSNVYGRTEALQDVQERITALHAPAVDQAWERFQATVHAPASGGAAPVAEGVAAIALGLEIAKAAKEVECPRCGLRVISNCDSRHGCPMPDIYAAARAQAKEGGAS